MLHSVGRSREVSAVNGRPTSCNLGERAAEMVCDYYNSAQQLRHTHVRTWSFSFAGYCLSNNAIFNHIPLSAPRTIITASEQA